MIIETHLPLAFTEIGQRPMNQDALYPFPGLANYQTRLFVICDGMNEGNKGEVASHLLCEAIARYEALSKPARYNQEQVKQAIANALNQYASFMKRNPLVNRMGSTLALLQLHDHGATVAHVGNSRVFQIRQGQIIFQTNNSQQVNSRTENGITSNKQGQTHAWYNHLSRAVILSSSDLANNTLTIPEPHMNHITNVQPGDYFFMCTDGLLERIDNNLLSLILKGDTTDEGKLQKILQLCTNNVSDNYSGYLIHIKAINASQSVLSRRG